MEPVAVLAARAEREAAGRLAVDKRTTAEAATALIRDGDHVAIGGTLYSRTPMALVFALLRHRCPPGPAADYPRTGPRPFGRRGDG